MNIIPFNFESHRVRVIDIDGDPWFVAADVAGILGYVNQRDAIAKHCRGVAKRDIPTTSGVQQASIIPERDVYRLIMRSRLPSAEQFEEWVVGQVLPSIRKTGTYQTQAFPIPQTLPDALRLAADLADQVQEQQRQIETQKPAVEFVERFVEARSAKSLREVAKVLGIKEREFINRLVDERILFRQAGSLLPFAQFQHRGLFTVKTGEANGHAYQQTRFTPEGINWISKRFGLIAGGDAV